MSDEEIEGQQQGTEKPKWPPPGTEGFLVKRLVLFNGRAATGIGYAVDSFETYENVLLYAAGNLVDIITQGGLKTVPANRIWEFVVDHDHPMYQHRMAHLPKAMKGWQKANERKDIDELPLAADPGVG